MSVSRPRIIGRGADLSAPISGARRQRISHVVAARPLLIEQSNLGLPAKIPLMQIKASPD